MRAMNVARSALALLLAAVSPAVASAQSHCTQETLDVRGTPVTIGYCVAGPARAGSGEELMVPVAATYASAAGSFSRAGELRFVAGERVSRVLENVDLHPVGVPGTLHLTLAYAGGVVRIEGAILTPGAVTVK